MPFVTPKSTSTPANSAGAGGRTSFRPPWVKDDGAASGLKSTVKTSVPWAKKTAAEKENGEKPSTNSTSTSAKKPATTPTASKTEPASKKPAETAASTKKTVEPLKKANEVAKKVVEPVKKTIEPVKKFGATVAKTPEPVKKPTTSNAKTAPVKKKEPTPPSSSSEEEESEEEEETEEETEEEETEEESDEEETEEESEPIKQPLKKVSALKPTAAAAKKEEEESELKRRFSIEKPKLRPVVVKRDKSMKKIENDDEAEEGETEEERERRLRFKLEKPKLRHVKREEKPLPSKSSENVLKIRPALKKVPKVEEIIKEPKEDPKPEFKTKTLRKAPSIKREQSIKNVPAPPPLPSLVPKAPPPPPPPLGAPGADKRELSNKQKAVLDKLKTRPRRRPDWSEMMQEVESGKKLRHVECNDRSQPILSCKSMTKVDDKFIFETEKANSHNKLLQQIQGGVRLKPTNTNDRSKPFIEGLRKFRKQMTIEEQLQKSQSRINMLGEIPGATDVADLPIETRRLVAALSIDDGSADELDDIDEIRDDLQSTKQMLALELRNREAKERENKKLLAKIATLEAELEREKSREKNLEYGSNVIVATMEATPATEDAYVKSLIKEAEDARKTSKDLEKKYLTTGELLDQAKSDIEEQRRQIQLLERKLAQALQGNTTPDTKAAPQFNFCYAFEEPNDFDFYYGQDNANEHGYNHLGTKGGGSMNGSRRASDAHAGRDSSPELDLQLSESDPDEPEEKKTERREKRAGKEVKILKSKLTKLKSKQEAAKKEKVALKQAMKKNHVILKEETKKFKKLEKEVHKMAASMKEDETADEEKEDDEDEEEAAEEEQEEESEEESEESESEESEADTASESEAEDATNTSKKANLEPRVKNHESRLSAMKKCNVLLQANVDNLQDEITQTRAKAANLQSELDAVLADLGF